MNKQKITKFAAVFLAFALWQLVAMKIDSQMLLASPVQALARLWEVIGEPEFLSRVFFSFGRITLGFLLAFVFGILFGILGGRFPVVETLLWPYVVTIKTVPVASFIILCLIWLDYTQLTVLIAFLIAFPMIYSNVLTGIKSIDSKMKEMARLYKMSWGKQLLYIYLPSVKPYLLSAAAVAIGMAWKAGVAAEVIGIVEGSIGEMLYESKVYFLNADLLCWTVVIILANVLTEKLIVFLLKTVFKGVEKL